MNDLEKQYWMKSCPSCSVRMGSIVWLPSPDAFGTRNGHTHVNCHLCRSKVAEKKTVKEVMKKHGVRLNHVAKTKLSAFCPIAHHDTPSFFIDIETDRFHCFGCGKGGTAEVLEALLLRKESSELGARVGVQE